MDPSSTHYCLRLHADEPRGLSMGRILDEASDLLSDDGENTEYDRAIAEMTTALLGLSTDDKSVVLVMLRAMKS